MVRLETCIRFSAHLVGGEQMITVLHEFMKILIKTLQYSELKTFL